MPQNISQYIGQLSGKLDDHAYKASDSLARIGSEEVVNAMIDLLNNPNPESRIMAAMTLGKVNNNRQALHPLLEAIKAKENRNIAGELISALEGFDVSNIYIELFRLFLFGSFKGSLIAKELLDYQEFEITPRVLRKAEKHWKHYANNVKHDEAYKLKEKEVNEMLKDIRKFLEDNT
jgi:HEAT repeat protein